ncbi:hypothetical protein EDI_067050 [Entamoeba dispar SAW760]|uniref:Uncharacterized protein n=1 Tax=Entamoeba dispar (strain ATCC PRA-260 / SAW760) TaxID=370354 RepID=B0EFZ6_ENTDS|nr:uncharacterized protein EDI_067050 [Entamoeba dispar SAW760]EDR26547.1 hypothetical protein EDI_067050 [Entamoeba dispar SAW760]|eukprot:EDR26547.1 hypothetical protein EDI_067050 [Entamoeba dispar SAW760]
MLTIPSGQFFIVDKWYKNIISHKVFIICSIVLVMFACQGDTHFCIFQNHEQQWMSFISHSQIKEGFEFGQFKITTFSKNDELMSYEELQIPKSIGDKLNDYSVIVCLHNCGALAIWFMALFVMIF